jgi:DNA primase
MPDRLHRIPDAELDELRARVPLVELIGRRVKLARCGRQMKGCCPFHHEKTPSFYVYDDGYHCFGCGAHGDAIDFVMAAQGICFQEAFRLLRSEAGLDSLSAPIRNDRPAIHLQKTSTSTFPWAVSLARESLPAASTIVENYIWSRGGALPECGVIRFHPSVRWRGLTQPAMVAAMTDPASARFVGLKCTFLKPDGTGKSDFKPNKINLGNKGVVRLAPDDEITAGLGICEGIETGLAIMQRAGWVAMWAAGDDGGITKFPVLPGIECLTIFPDLDDGGAGRKAAEACADRWAAAGREVQTIWPPGGLDWNDALVRRAA